MRDPGCVKFVERTLLVTWSWPITREFTLETNHSSAKFVAPGSIRSRICTLTFGMFTWENGGILAQNVEPSFVENASLTVTLTRSTREKSLTHAVFALLPLFILNTWRSMSKLTGIIFRTPVFSNALYDYLFSAERLHCPDCNKTFKSKTSLENHRSVHKPSSHYQVKIS